ncbi:MAG: DNA polymerase I [Verrucomicrobiota bacterium]
MAKRLFLLDGMALVYRAHFAFIARPILTSKGVNTSALYGFTQTLLDVMSRLQPTHLAVAFDTEAPTARHTAYPEYKATRQSMPEDLADALPHVRRMIEAFRVPVLACDGFEADDIIGTLARRAEREGFQTFMVTPDKDFGQLVDANTFLLKPGRAGDEAEILGVPEILARWGIQRPEQVVDVLALMGDASDNVPGVPGIGEKTAIKLIAQFGSVENLLARTAELKGRVRDSLEANRDLALLSKKLVTILSDAPCPADLESLKLRPADEEAVKSLCREFEFNSIGRRLFGDEFRAGRGFQPAAEGVEAAPAAPQPAAAVAEPAPPVAPAVEVPHEYSVADTAALQTMLAKMLRSKSAIALAADFSGEETGQASLAGLAFSVEAGRADYVPLPSDSAAAAAVLEKFRSVLESEKIAKLGHDLKPLVGALSRAGVRLGGELFDTLIAHSLLDGDQRHAIEYLSEALLGRVLAAGGSGPEQLDLGETAVRRSAERAGGRADVAGQLRPKLEPRLGPEGQSRVFSEIEIPLVPVLADMENEGIRVDAAALAEFSAQLSKEMSALEHSVHALAGREFNMNSPRQLGEVLFEELEISKTSKKTRTGQHATDEQTLMTLAPEHEIVRKLLEYRAAAKLKSTYADALPAAIRPGTGRIHTTYQQVMTSTGRLSSQNPNLQNIPIRTERGQEIRKAFVPRDPEHLLLSADYSQIELRIIAALSREAGLLEAFRTGTDVHTATAARVFGVALDAVTPEMRRKAKMVNYGIAYGISAFGLSQRLGIPRKEGSAIIEEYFKQFAGIRQYMDGTIAFAREKGFAATVTGRRRYLRDISSANGTVRAAAERNAINAPIQGTAADMIKLAMVGIHAELRRRKLRTRMLLQVHDELVFDLFRPEETEVRQLVEQHMTTALPLDVPIEVEMGVGKTWLEAH